MGWVLIAAGLCLTAPGVSAQDATPNPGQLRVLQDGIRVEIPDRSYVFKAGQQARLFQIHDNNLIVYHEIDGVPHKLYAVFWTRSDAPAWVSNERAVTFGRITPSIRGELVLDRGEILPIVAVGRHDYRVQVQRFGLVAEVDLPREREGLAWEPRAAAAQGTTAVGASTNRARIVISGSGMNVTVRDGGAPDPQPPTVEPAPPPAVAVEPVPPPAVVPPVAVVTARAPVLEPVPVPAASTSHVARVVESRTPVALDWPSPFQDPLNQAIIGGFSFLIVILVLVRRRQNIHRKSRPRMMSAAARRTAIEGDIRAEQEKEQAAGGGERKLTLRSDRASLRPTSTVAATSATPKQGYGAPPSATDTVILMQNVPGAAARRAVKGSAMDTTIIPSPPVLPGGPQGNGKLWIGKYSVEQLLGRGRTGVVYKVHQADLNRIVALKLLAEGSHASARTRERFIREARAIAALRHPNIITIYEVGEWEGQPYFTMELIEGRSLDKEIARNKMGCLDAAKLTLRIVEALGYAHERGIIHRDLKPGNIIIDNKGLPFITDFGLARHIGTDPAMSGDDILGTPAYMAPEQARGRTGEIDTRSDLYAIGAILYALVTGRDAFTGGSLLETLHKVIHERPEPPDEVDPDVDAEISGICMKAMNKDPKKRHATAAEMAEELQHYISRHEASGPGGGPAPVTRRGGLLGRLFGRRG